MVYICGIHFICIIFIPGLWTNEWGLDRIASIQLIVKDGRAAQGLQHNSRYFSRSSSFYSFLFHLASGVHILMKDMNDSGSWPDMGTKLDCLHNLLDISFIVYWN